MEHAELDICNHAFGAPPGHEDATGTLPVRIEENEEYGHALRSYWTPTAAELGELARGGHIRLSIYGAGHPPVSLAVVTAADPRSVFVGQPAGV